MAARLQLRPATHATVSSSRANLRRSTRAVSVFAAKSKSRTDTLRELLQRPGIIKGPCCHDALSARLIERAGFDFAFMSGFCTAGARLGAPDTGLISYYEMMDQGRYIHEATSHMPIIGDGDTGYGNAMNVKRTVRGYAQAGFAGILIEDQVAPKSCGHVRGKRVTSREEALSRIRAAVDARDEGADILIVARTDARQAVSLDEALWRAQAFAEAGADVIFIDALESVEEMAALCELGAAARRVPKMANMLEGGGKTPILSPAQLQEMGFKLVAYPLSLLAVSVRAMEAALSGLKDGVVPSPEAMGSFSELQAAVGFPEYFREEGRYAVKVDMNAAAAAGSSGAAAGNSQGPDGAGSSAAVDGRDTDYSYAASTGAASSTSTSTSGSERDSYSGSASSTRSSEPAVEVVEADAIIVPARQDQSGQGSGDGSSGSGTRRDEYFRVVIRDKASGYVKLETKIPAGFMAGIRAIVPQVAGMNLEQLLGQALGQSSQGSEWDRAKPLVDFDSGLDNIKVFLE